MKHTKYFLIILAALVLVMGWEVLNVEAWLSVTDSGWGFFGSVVTGVLIPGLALVLWLDLKR